MDILELNPVNEKHSESAYFGQGHCRLFYDQNPLALIFRRWKVKIPPKSGKSPKSNRRFLDPLPTSELSVEVMWRRQKRCLCRCLMETTWKQLWLSWSWNILIWLIQNMFRQLMSSGPLLRAEVPGPRWGSRTLKWLQGDLNSKVTLIVCTQTLKSALTRDFWGFMVLPHEKWMKCLSSCSKWSALTRGRQRQTFE